MAGRSQQGIVVGDRGTSRYIYVDWLPETEPNLRGAWLDARDVATVYVPGGASQVARCLGWPCLAHQAVSEEEPTLESTYILTRRREETDPGEERVSWKVGTSIVAGERQAEFETPPAEALAHGDTPLAVVDYHQGWLRSNWEGLPGLLKGRPYLVRTHDPTRVLGGEGLPDEYGRLWATIREQSDTPGVWFSPYQDMADGALKVAGNWETVTANIIAYLKRDGEALWDGDWRHHVVIQIAYDGALILGPGGRETILAFPGDQPESFRKRRLGTVVGGGVVINASIGELLAAGPVEHEALVDSVGIGLARARRLLTCGYADPPGQRGTFVVAEDEGAARWTLCALSSGPGDPCAELSPAPTDWNVYPAEALAVPDPDELPRQYVQPVQDDATISAIIGGTKQALRREIVYSVGKLFTCDPVFANQLIRLEDRINTHVGDEGDGVLSVAVLGGPGSGKSFATKQVLDSVGGDLEPIEFNVSQFAGPEQLVDALREVQALSLQGKVPFVFWDEFDCVREGKQGGWLSSFLMPMQDAKFWDGSGTARLGKCIFMFVGSMWETKHDFDAWVEDKGRLLKGRDFHSRLDRVLQVPSIAPLAEGAPRLMRALLIRLGVKDAGITEIDRDVVDFLLDAEFAHGIRSLNTVIGASQLGRTGRFCAYHLPPDEVLQVHLKKLLRPEGQCGSTVKLEWAGERD